jgi:tripartite-type tricarboxylate transporter receptor subunit TctC
MVLVRSGTPPAVVQAIGSAVNGVLAQPAIRTRLTEMAMQVVPDSTPDLAAGYLASEIARWEPLVRAAGIRAE